MNRNNLRNRKMQTLTKFRGVDYASSPVDVKPYRATDAANFILRDDILRKRHGFEQLLHVIPELLQGDSNGEASGGEWETKFQSVGGVWQYNSTTLIIQAMYLNSSSFYKVIMQRSIGGLLTLKSVAPIAELLKNATKPGSAFLVNDKLYIACGDYLVFDGETLKSVATEALTNPDAAYVPTTTINIPRYGDEATGDEYTSYEPINALTPWRRNVLKNAPFCTTSTEYLEKKTIYKLDDQAETAIENAKITPFVRVEFSNGTSEDFKLSYSEIIEHTYIRPIWYYYEDDDDKGDKDFIMLEGNILTFSFFTKDWSDATVSIYFRTSKGSSDTETYTKISDSTRALTSCNIGTLFGVGGSNDRIFLGGSTEMPNICYYSANSISTQANPTYFPVDNTIVCGVNESPITAFLRVSDGTMAVFKSASMPGDVGVYYVSGNAVSTTDNAGVTLWQEFFSVKAGAIEQSGVTVKNVVNFDGDPLFVSKDGVFAIELSANVASAERYARARSRTINPRLRAADISKFTTFAYNGKLYVSVGGEEKEVYVADSRYQYTMSGDESGGFNYEWFRFTGVDAWHWFTLGGELYFIDSQGWICKFTDKYEDVYTTTGGECSIFKSDGSQYVSYNTSAKTLLEQAAYIEIDGQALEIGELTVKETEEGSVNCWKLPAYAKLENGPIIAKIHVPIKAYWKSAITALDGSAYRKNLWSMSITTMPTLHGRVDFGYKTRMNEVGTLQAEGANAFSFADIDFSMFSFDCGDFINSYRQCVFERGFVYIQLMFSSDSIGDCAVNEISIEYSITTKNIGVG